jgi:hypothetical protein
MLTQMMLLMEEFYKSYVTHRVRDNVAVGASIPGCSPSRRPHPPSNRLSEPAELNRVENALGCAMVTKRVTFGEPVIQRGIPASL